MHFQIGERVGDYEVVQVLGAGGMGKVYKVRNTISDRMEALKVLLPDLVGNPDLAESSQHRKPAHSSSSRESTPDADGVCGRRVRGEDAGQRAAAGG
jgi:serine/threonine protein kinase